MTGFVEYFGGPWDGRRDAAPPRGLLPEVRIPQAPSIVSLAIAEPSVYPEPILTHVYGLALRADGRPAYRYDGERRL